MKLTHNHQVYFLSDLHDFGRTEDGEKFIGEMFYVQLEMPDGARYVLKNSHTPGVRVQEYSDEDGCGMAFIDQRPQARARCNAIISRILAKGEVDLRNWLPDRPAYGSAAYCNDKEGIIWKDFGVLPDHAILSSYFLQSCDDVSREG